MWEYNAKKDIQKKYTIIDNERYEIKHSAHGGCDGCYFHRVIKNKIQQCPQKALDICCTGGNILIKNK